MHQAHVILVHGIWMNPLELLPFGHRLKRLGFKVHYFNYNSLLHPPAKAAEKLRAKINRLNAAKLHYVAHSLGGLVLMHLFEQFDDLPPGRVVMLGSPIQGSQLAQRLAGSIFLRPFVGRSMERALSGEDIPEWDNDREWAMLAGTKPLGIGSLFGGFDSPNDGTVLIDETRHPAQKQHLSLPYGHLKLLYSSATPTLTAQFLISGSFNDSRREMDGKLHP